MNKAVLSLSHWSIKLSIVVCSVAGGGSSECQAEEFNFTYLPFNWKCQGLNWDLLQANRALAYEFFTSEHNFQKT